MWARSRNRIAESSIDCERVATRRQKSISATPFHTWNTPNEPAWAYFYRQDQDYLVRFPKLADFLITSDGYKVSCWPVPAVSDETIQHLYLNQIMPLALSKQGRLVLHGSAIEIDNVAVAFVGQSGVGKSTLAASFGTSGYRVLSDDGLLLETNEHDYLVQPSHPSIRLWEDSQLAVIRQPARLAPPVQYTSKARILADDLIAFCDKPQPLKCVYILGDGQETQSTTLEPITAREALVELIRHSFLLEIEAQDMLAGHFDQLSRLVHKIMFYRLDYPRRFGTLAVVQRAILEHVSDRKMSHEPV